MRKKYLSIFFIAFLAMSCSPFRTLNSTTNIKAKDAFILGNNKHGKFYASVSNISNSEITIWQYPIDGGRHSPITLQPSTSTKVNVDKNTSLRIENPSNAEVAVKLKVKGDTGLSMGYKNK